MNENSKNKKTMMHKSFLMFGVFIFFIPYLLMSACEDKDDSKKPCEKNHTGDWCFKNESTETYRIEVDGNSAEPLILKPGESGSLYDLKVEENPHKYKSGPGPMWTMNPSTGQFKVVECQSDTTIIK